MDKKAINKYYYTQIIKTLLTAIGCLYLATYEDVRVFACVVGFFSSVLAASWIRDFVKVRRAMKNGTYSEEDYCYIDEYDDEDEE